MILISILLSWMSVGIAKVNHVQSEIILGQKDLGGYADRYQPLIYHDIYQGKMSFVDDIFYQYFFEPYLLEGEKNLSSFLKSELNAGQLCPNELLEEHFQDIRFSYRLITLSYFLEGQWHLNLLSEQLRLKNGCHFDLKEWLKSCRPQSLEMKKFIDRLGLYNPRYEESFPANYMMSDWWDEFKKKDYKWYSHYRMSAQCQDKCTQGQVESKLQQFCSDDKKLMSQICSETDEIYGLSHNRDAYYLLGLSNIINTYNKRGEAMGCLRRFSEVMSHKEVRYQVLDQLFPSLQTFLRQRHQERFLQGRVFFFGASKEFEAKGLKDFYVKEQSFKMEKPTELKEPFKEAVKVETTSVETKVPIVEAKPQVPKKAVGEIHKPIKSAFLQAAEMRRSTNLDRVEVDMLKLKYDYVFSLNMMNTLSERLKTFMTREALKEMLSYDKLGSKDAPVPLLFLKFMIDMQEHHGLWNINSVLGDKFYVENEIDAAFTPEPELIQLLNNQSTGGQWQIYILRPY